MRVVVWGGGRVQGEGVSVLKEDTRYLIVIEIYYLVVWPQIPTLSALAYHKCTGRTAAPPNQRLTYSENFLYMLDGGHSPDYRPNPRLARALVSPLVPRMKPPSGGKFRPAFPSQ